MSTSTADVPNACHPFSTKDFFKNNYVGVHNGVISNDNVLEKQHQAIGINYVSRQATGEFNDSEALIYDIARYLEGEVEELTAQGSIAFIIVKRNNDGKPVTLFFGRNSGNPLKMKKTKFSMTLSSEGKGKDIDANQLYSYDYETGEVTQRYMYIPYYSRYSGYNSNYSNGYSQTALGNSTSRESDYYNGDLWNDGDSDDVDDYYYGSARNIIENTKFKMMTGTKTEMLSKFMSESFGDYEEASIQALVEADEAEKEQRRLDSHIINAVRNGVYEDLSDWWYVLNTYMNLMMEISDELEQLAKLKDDYYIKHPKGDTVYESGIVVSPEERSLLPFNPKAV